jgi:mono/diheme cytochrome c family protein
MKRVLQILGILLAVVILAAGGAFAYASSKAEARLARTWPDVKGTDVPVPWPLTDAEVATLRETKKAELAAQAPEGADAAAEADPLAGVDLTAIAMERAVERGKYLANVRLACVECHGADLAGGLVVDAQPVWTWYAPNITQGARAKDFKSADWDRAIRHGVLPDGRSSTMPAGDYVGLSDRELSDLIAYAKSQPPSDKKQPATVIGPMGKILLGFGIMPINTEEIDHTKPHLAVPPEAAVTVEYGAHLASACVGCHRTTFDGGKIAQGPPDWPPARNLTPGGEMANWTKDDFIKTLRTGTRPTGEALKSPMVEMATVAKQMSDLELEAMFLFFKSLPPLPDGK